MSRPGSIGSNEPPAPGDGNVRPRRARRWAWARTITLTAVALLLIEYLAVPQIVRATSDLTLFADAAPLLLALAFALEVCSLATYTALTRAVLPRRVRPRFADQFRIDLTGLGVSHFVPGGAASASALRFRLMIAWGVPAAEAASTAAVQSVLAVIGLVATFAGGVALAGPGIVTHPAYAAGELPRPQSCWAQRLACVHWPGVPGHCPAPPLDVRYRRSGGASCAIAPRSGSPVSLGSASIPPGRSVVRQRP